MVQGRGWGVYFSTFEGGRDEINFGSDMYCSKKCSMAVRRLCALHEGVKWGRRPWLVLGRGRECEKNLRGRDEINSKE